MQKRTIDRAIITGGTGAVGMALIEELISQGVEVLVFCRKDSERNDRIPRHPMVSVLYCDLNQLEEVQNTTGKQYDVFYHFAWQGTTGESRNQMLLQNQNVKYALEAVKAAKRFGCRIFIGAGSQAEYGRVEGKLKADTAVFPENGYGMAKLCAGQMTRVLAGQLEMEHIWVRILSVYGPYDAENSMVMSTIRKLLRGEVPQFTKGEQYWDYLYSKDAAVAFRLLAEQGIDQKVYVLGSGQVSRLSEYIGLIRNVVRPGAAIELGAIPYSPKQVMYLCADSEALKKDVGFVPEVEFAQGIQRVVEWYKTIAEQEE